MKYLLGKSDLPLSNVTLCVRVWIEISKLSISTIKHFVTLCVRVWIEIAASIKRRHSNERHPLREGVD